MGADLRDSVSRGTEVFRLPDLGEGLADAEVLRWAVAVGDRVAVNQPLVEVETAKAVVEVPSPVAGVVRALGAEEGQVLAVGAPLVEFEFEDGSGAAASAPPPGASERNPVLVGYGPRAAGAASRRPRRRPPAVPAQSDRSVEPTPTPSSGAPARPLASPPVRKLARELGLDLTAIVGTGPAGVVTRADVERHRLDTTTVTAPTTGAIPAAAVAERIPVRGVRRSTAEAMVRSAAVPQASVHLAVDVSDSVAWLDRLAGRPDAPSLLTLVARAVTLALAERPLLHASWSEAASGGAEIIVPRSLDLGIAVAAPRGLLVPVVRDAAALSLRRLRAAIDDVVQRARAGTLTPGELAGGTFTISNVGVLGVDGGTALVPPGQTAILCVGAVHLRPWVVDDALAVRGVVELSLSIDHRVVDGAEASAFLADLGELLADPGLVLARS